MLTAANVLSTIERSAGQQQKEMSGSGGGGGGMTLEARTKKVKSLLQSHFNGHPDSNLLIQVSCLPTLNMVYKGAYGNFDIFSAQNFIIRSFSLSHVNQSKCIPGYIFYYTI